MAKSAKREWAACFGVLALLVGVGTVTTFAAPRRAQAQQQPARTPEQIFNRACGRCHPGGGEDIGPDIHNANKTVEQMTTIIRNGTKRMRPITPARLSDPDLEAMLPYLRSLHAVR